MVDCGSFLHRVLKQYYYFDNNDLICMPIILFLCSSLLSAIGNLQHQKLEGNIDNIMQENLEHVHVVTY